MALVEGNSVRSTSRLVGVNKNTVLKFIVDLGQGCIEYHNNNIYNIKSKEIQCDEIWGFCYAKDRNVPKSKKGKGTGSVWTWVSMDTSSRFIINWLLASRGIDSGKIFINDLAKRITGRTQITTDAHGAYFANVIRAFPNCDYGMLVKSYPYVQKVHRYSPAVNVKISKKVLHGSPDINKISTSYVERGNLNIRMCVRRLTRLTNGFSKKFYNMQCALAIYFMYYNFCKTHGTIKTSPAVSIGLIKSSWSLNDLLGISK